MLIFGMTIGQVFTVITLIMGMLAWGILLGQGLGWCVGMIIDHWMTTPPPASKKKDE